ncbi:M56 family metallopeptidase [Mycobacterium sp. IDR2000157661]|uniref:M56 family metallopeptidase n=1 Tax=Mycobacterium sp. IDR2000157661 TaxID=2867005 RepID=UPI001EEEF88E|nr:M56 family metallopeptidase [Mycobacterium sp. IDR2000157661]ULE34934.1 M56 family metallopeptidase [Mycobacterium sp. IDR2000157661]
MTVAACLLLYGLVVLLVGPPVLRRLTRSAQLPRLGVAAWLTAIATMLISGVAAVAALLAQLVNHWDHRQYLIASCVAQIRVIATGQAGTLPRLALLGAAIAAAVLVMATAARLAATLTAMRRRSHRHAEAVRVVGRRTAAPDVLVLDADEPAAYCVSARPPAIVVTSAAVVALNEEQLEAVIAHERAHLAGYHPQVVAALRVLAKALPRVKLITEGAEHISRLLEMCADDTAARRHGRQPLLAGLLAMSGATPAGALGAADVAVLERAHRLTSSRGAPAHRRCAAALTGTMTVIAAGPVLIAAMAASGLLMCGMQ